VKLLTSSYHTMLTAHVDLNVGRPLAVKPLLPPPRACPSDILANFLLTIGDIQVLHCMIALENCTPSPVRFLDEAFRNSAWTYWRSSLIA